MNYSRTRNIRLLLSGILLLVIMVLVGCSPQVVGTVVDPPMPMPDFTLQSVDGPVSLSDFRGKYVVLFFGYTFCPDVCPLSLGNLRSAMDKLGSQSEDIQVVFVSVDWRRDTPETMGKYVSHFSPDFVGLSGTQEEIDAVTKDFNIFYLLYPPDQDGRYTVDHSATTQVLDREGNLKLIWPYEITSSDMASDLRILLKE